LFVVFREAAKAVQDINDRKNEGLQIRAEFAHPRRRDDDPITSSTANIQPMIADGEKEPEQEEEELHPPIFIDFNILQLDANDEKISAFERQKSVVSCNLLKQLKINEKLAEQSNWKFDEVKVK
jgi:hypothetical protein